ncbi:MAG: hypothetical protein KH292_06300, partial [Collinsella sp.]|nr:hypothetical protein [Collinsella sp.]
MLDAADVVIDGHPTVGSLTGEGQLSVVRIGTFTSVSRIFLPGLMMEFKKEHPDIRFILQQGEYTSIARWVENKLHKSTQNRELIELLKLEKSLVYFTT